MDKVRSTLGHVRDSFHPPPGGFDRLAARRERRLRIRRATAGAMALALTAGLIVGLSTVMRPGVSAIKQPTGFLSVNIGAQVIDVAVGEGAVWAVRETDESGRGEVVRIDPENGRVVARIALPKVGQLAAEDGAVWVQNRLARGREIRTDMTVVPVINVSGAETVTRVDPATNQIDRVIDVPDFIEVESGDAPASGDDVYVVGPLMVQTRGKWRGSETLSGGHPLARVEIPRSIFGAVVESGTDVLWSLYEPPEAEVVRVSSDGVAHDAAARGSAGLFVLNRDTGAVSLLGAFDAYGALDREVPVSTVGESADAITVADGIIYVGGISGSIYAIDQSRGLTLKATVPHIPAKRIARVSGRPSALHADDDTLWVSSSDGMVTGIPLRLQGAPEPQISPSPLPTAEKPRECKNAGNNENQTGRIAGAFYPRTYQEGENAIMPLTFVDGTEAELVFGPGLRAGEIGLFGITVAGLKRIDRDIYARHGDRIYEMHCGPIEKYEGREGTTVEVWEPPPDEEDCPYLIFRFGKWVVTARTCSPDLSIAEKAEWARSLGGRVTDDGFLILESTPPLVLQKTGGNHGPEMLLETHGEGPFIVLRPGKCEPLEPAENEEVRVFADGVKANFSFDGDYWYASWCEDGAMYVGVEAPDRAYVEAAMERLRVRNLSLAG